MQTMKHLVTLYEYIKSFFDLKMATSFLVSVSVFSIIVSRFSLQPFLLNIFELSYFSAYKTIDKNYVFLLCNGILVFIFKNSLGFKNNSPQEPVAMVSTKIVCKERYNRRISSIVEKNFAQEPELVCKKRYDRRISSIVEKKVAQEPELVCKERYNRSISSIIEKNVAQEPELVCKERYNRSISSIVEKKVAQEPELFCKERYNRIISSIVEKKVAQEPELVCKERYNGRISSIIEKKVAQEPELALVPVVAEEKQVQVQENEFEDEDEEEDGSLSREELNKKCDDFIRRMKEVIRFEALLI